MELARHTYNIVNAALMRQATVALLGPRQVGKTTLAQKLAKEQENLYLDLQDPGNVAMLSEPLELFNYYQDRLIILDEVHLVPEIFKFLKISIDKGRREGNRNGRFLILGSASIDIVNQSNESLAGRIEFVNLHPFSVLEVSSIKMQLKPGIDIASPAYALNLEHHDRKVKNLWIRGGFPDSYFAKDDVESSIYRANFIQTYLERDISQFGFKYPALVLRSLWTMLAHNQGQTMNISKLASSLSISTATVYRYIDLLEKLLLIRRLHPYHGNVKKRLVKSPKFYIRDSGILHSLLGITTFSELLSHPVAGSSWEGFVIENLLNAAPWNTNASFFRTSAGAEIDLVLEIPARNEVWAIEIKHGLPKTVSKGFHYARKDINPDRSFVVHSGEAKYPMSNGIEAIGIIGMTSLLQFQNLKYSKTD